MMTRKEFLDWLETVPEDEPIFCLRAKDYASLAGIDEYIAECIKLGSPSDHIETIEKFLDEFRDWQLRNGEKCKVPD